MGQNASPYSVLRTTYTAAWYKKANCFPEIRGLCHCPVAILQLWLGEAAIGSLAFATSTDGSTSTECGVWNGPVLTRQRLPRAQASDFQRVVQVLPSRDEDP